MLREKAFGKIFHKQTAVKPFRFRFYKYPLQPGGLQTFQRAVIHMQASLLPFLGIKFQPVQPPGAGVCRKGFNEIFHYSNPPTRICFTRRVG